MSVQLQYSYFPVREAEMKTRIEYVTLTPGEAIQVGSATITPYLLNHPVIDLGYRIESNGKSINKFGEKVTYKTSGVIFGVSGTDAQHSFFQLLHQFC